MVILLNDSQAKLPSRAWERDKRKHKTESQFQFWQEGSHPEEMNNDTMLMQRLAYIHNNPVKRGYVDLPEHWRYSSARAYMGKDSLLPIALLY
jgi:putative transposase